MFDVMFKKELSSTNYNVTCISHRTTSLIEVNIDPYFIDISCVIRYYIQMILFFKYPKLLKGENPRFEATWEVVFSFIYKRLISWRLIYVS